MKKLALLSAMALLALFTAANRLAADSDDFSFRPLRHPMRFKEDFFTKYASYLIPDPDYVSRNIFFLELAYTLPWDDPIRALVPVTNQMQYAKYQNLLMMHICLMLTKEYINYGYLYFKEHVYFYNRDYFTNYLQGYEVAEKYFNDARGYWDQTIHFAQMADAYTGWHMNLNFDGIHIAFEDEVYRIKTGDLNFYPIIDNLMVRLNRNRDVINAALTNGG